MPISDKYKLLFVHIPKNAGTSLEKCLNARVTGHRRWKKYRDDYPLQWSTYTNFAVLRDPVERFISCYHYARMEKSFWHSSIPGDQSVYGEHPDYDLCKSKTICEVADVLINNRKLLHHPGWNSQYYWIAGDNDIAVDCLVDFAKLDAGMAELAPGITIGHINESSSSRKSQLSDKSMSMLKEAYSLDSDLYRLFERHKKNILWTQQGKSKNL